jgi:MFS family permease
VTDRRNPSGERSAPAGDFETARAGWIPAWFTRDLGFLLAARAFRSIAAGYLNIILPLYLALLGYNAVHLGILFSVCGIAGAILAAVTGVLADRFGRRMFLVVMGLAMAVGSAVFAVTDNFALMVAAAAIGTIGYSGPGSVGGGWGPSYPAAQSLLAGQTPDHRRTTLFGLVSFVGVISAALGSLLAAAPKILHRSLGLATVEGYRALFFLAGALGLAMALSVLPVGESRPLNAGESGICHGGQRHRASVSAGARLKMFGLSRDSWRLVGRFMVTNATNGFAIGMLGPFVVYWFYRRYGADATNLAALFFVINLAAAVPYLLAGRVALRLGAVATVVSARGVSTVLLGCLVLMPTFFLAAMLYTIRMLFNLLSVPVRQSYLMGVIDPSERASAAGLSNMPSRATQSISAYFAGYLMQHVALGLPLEIAATLQGLNTMLYYLFFRKIRPPEEAKFEGTLAGSDQK